MRCTAQCWFKAATLIGAFLMCVPNALIWYWGNMAVYIQSYMRMTKVIQGSLESPWLLSVFIISWCLTLIIAETVAKYLGRKLTMALGIVIIDGGLFVSYFSVQHSLQALNVTQGLLGGIGNGLIYAIVMHYIIDSTDKHFGAFTAGVSLSGKVGSALVNQLVSFYVNPKNRVPDLQLGPAKYFTNIAIVQNVPSAFLMLAAFFLTIHLVGFVTLMTVKPSSFDHKKTDSSDGSLNGSTSHKEEGGTSDRGEVSEDENVLTYMPTEVLRTKTFYVLWIALVFTEIGFIVHTNYYKFFGQVSIENDHYLASLGTAMSIVAGGSNLLWGMLIDRFGAKYIMITFASSLSLAFSFYYFTPILSSILYYFWSLLITVLDGGFFSNFAVVTLKLFGAKHFATNYGMVMTSSIALNLVAPMYCQFVLHNWGWFALFFNCGFMTSIGLILVILMLPKDRLKNQESVE